MLADEEPERFRTTHWSPEFKPEQAANPRVVELRFDAEVMDGGGRHSN